MSSVLAERRGKVMTVTGLVDPDTLGATLIHEHIFIDISCYYRPPTDPEGKQLEAQPLRLSNLGWVRQNSMSSQPNLHLDDPEIAVAELGRFSNAGGGAVVDQTPVGIGRNPAGLRDIAIKTGLHIIAGSGYYIGASHPPEIVKKTRDQLTDEIIRDTTRGIDHTGVIAGIIGEIGTSWPLQPSEEKVLRAAAQAQKQTGAPMSIHPGTSHEAPQRVIAILREEAVNLGRVLMSHIEARYRGGLDDYKSLADTGCNLAFDTFGRDQYFAALGRQHPQDDQRIDVISELVRQGYARQIMLSQDVCYRSDLFSYGGHGYAHVLRNIVPRLESRGVPKSETNTMLVLNPKKFLSFQ